jgi:hypothetical protein
MTNRRGRQCQCGLSQLIFKDYQLKKLEKNKRSIMKTMLSKCNHQWEDQIVECQSWAMPV